MKKRLTPQQVPDHRRRLPAVSPPRERPICPPNTRDTNPQRPDGLWVAVVLFIATLTVYIFLGQG